MVLSEPGGSITYGICQHFASKWIRIDHNGGFDLRRHIRFLNLAPFMPYMKLHPVKSEPQNIEYRMSKGGFASLSHFL